MNKTIEDRAIAWSEQHREMYNLDSDEIAEVSYNQGAIDQRKIDIDKACEWLDEVLYSSGMDKNRLLDAFRKSMEE